MGGLKEQLHQGVIDVLAPLGYACFSTLRITEGRAALRNRAELNQRWLTRPLSRGLIQAIQAGWVANCLSSINRWAQSISTTPVQVLPSGWAASSWAALSATTPPMELPTNSTGLFTTCRQKLATCFTPEVEAVMKAILDGGCGLFSLQQCLRLAAASEADQVKGISGGLAPRAGMVWRQWSVFAPKP